MAIDTIKFKRGNKNKLDKLSYGEPAYISDEGELYIGTESGVEKLTRNKEVEELSSQLAHKANKNEVFSMANMGQDIKEAMTGGSVAVVGVNSILEDNILDNQVTEEKISFIELPINYNYFKNKNPYKANHTFDSSGNIFETIDNSIYRLRVNPKTQYKFSNNNNGNANNVPIQKIVYSSKCDYENGDDKISIVNDAFDSDFTTPENCYYIYVVIKNSADITNWSLQKGNTPSYPILNPIIKGVELESVNLIDKDLKNFKEMVNKEILLNPYPFKYATINEFNIKLRELVKDIKLEGADKTKKYSVIIFRKNTDTNFLLNIFPTDESGTSTNAEGFNITYSDLNVNQKTGLQKIIKDVFFGRLYITLDMAVYHSLKVFQTSLTYDIGGIHENAYIDKSYELKLSSPLQKDRPIITLIDDDGGTNFSYVKEVMDTYGYKCSLGIVTDWVGTSGFMTLEQLKTLKNEGFEMLSHSKSHSPEIWYDVNMSLNNRGALLQECQDSWDWMYNNGFETDTIVYPSGGWSSQNKKIIERECSKVYDFGLCTEAKVMTDNVLRSTMLNRVAINMSVNDIQYYKDLIDSCKNDCGWLILFCHAGSKSEVNKEFLTQIFDYIKSSNIEVMTFRDANKIKRNICSEGLWGSKKSLYIGRDGTIKNDF